MKPKREHPARPFPTYWCEDCRLGYTCTRADVKVGCPNCGKPPLRGPVVGAQEVTR